MKLSYEALISGDRIHFDGVGHLVPPKVRDLMPSKIGGFTYNLYINVLMWTKEEYVNFLKEITGKKLTALTENKKLTIFDTMMLFDQPREIVLTALGFFMSEKLIWNENSKKIETFDCNRKVGEITRENFDEIRDVMLQLNYINIGDSAKPVTHTSEKTRELWEKAQEYLKKTSVKSTNDKAYELGNIISKLCAAGIGYTLFNIFDLTIFQLYDQFFQYGYLRAMNVNEMAFSNHGGENFEIRSWLKPILKI